MPGCHHSTALLKGAWYSLGQEPSLNGLGDNLRATIRSMKAMGGLNTRVTALLDQGQGQHTAGLNETQWRVQMPYSSPLSHVATAATWPHQATPTKHEIAFSIICFDRKQGKNTDFFLSFQIHSINPKAQSPCKPQHPGRVRGMSQ